MLDSISEHSCKENVKVFSSNYLVVKYLSTKTCDLSQETCSTTNVCLQFYKANPAWSIKMEEAQYRNNRTAFCREKTEIIADVLPYTVDPRC